MKKKEKVKVFDREKNIHTHTDKEIKFSSLFVHKIWNESQKEISQSQ